MSIATNFPGNFVSTFDQISNTARLPNSGAPSAPHTSNDQIAEWNARLYSPAVNRRQPQQPQRQQVTSAFQTPPNSAQGPTGVFGANRSRSQKTTSHPHFHRVHDADESSENNTRVSAGGGLPPFRPDMSVSNLSSTSHSPSTNSMNPTSGNSNTNTAPAPSVPNVALPLSSLSDNNGLSLDMLNSPVSIDLGVMDPFSTLFPYGNPPLGGEPLGAHIAHGHNAPSGLTPVPVGSAGGGGGGGGYMPSALSVLL